MLYNVVVEEEEEEEEEERVAVGTCRHRRDRKKRTSMVRGARAGVSFRPVLLALGGEGRQGLAVW